MFTAIGFLSLFGFAVFYALARSPIFGLYAYLAAFFVHPPSRWWGSMLPDLRWVLLGGMVALLAIFIHREKLAPKPLWTSNAPAAILVSFCVWLWIQNLWALDSPTHLDASIQYVKYLIAFYLVYRVIDSKDRLRDFLFAHTLGCAMLGAIATFAGRMSAGRLDGIGGPGIDDSNTLAMYLATGALTGAGIVLAQSGWRRYVCLVGLVFIANGFVLANSRGSLLGLFAGGVILMMAKATHHRRLFWALTVIAAIGAGSLIDQRFISRMFTIANVLEDVGTDSSAESRVVLYKAQLKMFQAYPHGSGHRGTAVLSPQYMDARWLTRGAADPEEGNAYRSSHNTLMTTLVEQGVPGIVLFLCLLAWFGKTTLRLRRWGKENVDPQLVTYTAAVCASLTVVIVAGMATDYLMAEVQFWLFAALVCALQLRAGLAPAAVPARRAVPVGVWGHAGLK
jgi:O-antigen ligase